MQLGCIHAIFLAAAPPLQTALLPALASLDAARAAGGRVIGLHLRSGYADVAQHSQHALVRRLREARPGFPLPAAAGAAALRHGWGIMDAAFPGCRSEAHSDEETGGVDNTAAGGGGWATGAVTAAAAALPGLLPPAPERPTSAGAAACHRWDAWTAAAVSGARMGSAPHARGVMESVSHASTTRP